MILGNTANYPNVGYSAVNALRPPDGEPMRDVQVATIATARDGTRKAVDELREQIEMLGERLGPFLSPGTDSNCVNSAGVGAGAPPCSILRSEFDQITDSLKLIKGRVCTLISRLDI